MQRWEEAIGDYEAVLAASPKDPSAWNNLVRAAAVAAACRPPGLSERPAKTTAKEATPWNSAWVSPPHTVCAVGARGVGCRRSMGPVSAVAGRAGSHVPLSVPLNKRSEFAEHS